MIKQVLLVEYFLSSSSTSNLFILSRPLLNQAAFKSPYLFKFFSQYSDFKALFIFDTNFFLPVQRFPQNFMSKCIFLGISLKSINSRVHHDIHTELPSRLPFNINLELTKLRVLHQKNMTNTTDKWVYDNTAIWFLKLKKTRGKTKPKDNDSTISNR